MPRLAALGDARWVVAFALVVFGANLAVSQMRGDSIVYAAVSKNLVESGDPMRLTLAGEPYLNKPPLYFWLTAAVMTVAGTGMVGAKLGALLASTGLCVLLYRGTRRIFDDRAVGLAAVVVFAATYVVYRNTYHARMESLVTLLVLASLLCFWRWLAGPRRLAWLLGWGVCAGLGVLTKGPVGFLPVAAGLAWILVAERGAVRGAGIAQLALGLAAFAATFGWWFAAQGGELATTFLGEEIFDRSVFGIAREGHRWWSVYWTKLLGYDLPWMAAAAFGATRAIRIEHLRRPVGLLLTAAAIHLVIIHLVEEKTARYLYQLYAFTAPLSAYGILSIRRFDPEPILKAVIVCFAIGLQFTGTSRTHDHFRPMREAARLGAASGLPVVGYAGDFGELDERAAFDYYLAGRVSEPTGPASFIAVLPRSNPLPEARTLASSDRVWVGLAQRHPDDPIESAKGTP